MEIQDFTMPKILNLIAYLGQLCLFIIGNINILSKWPTRK